MKLRKNTIYEKKGLRNLVLFLTMIMIGGLSQAGSFKVEAANKTKKEDAKYIKADAEYNRKDHKLKAGKYYFWFEYSSDNGDSVLTSLFFSKDKNSKGRKLLADAWVDEYPESICMETNGRYVYYQDSAAMKKGWIKRLDIKSGKKRTYKINRQYIEYHVYGKNIYINENSKKVKVYNTKTKTMKTLKASKSSWKASSMIGRNRYLYFFYEGKNILKVYRYDIKKNKTKVVKKVKLSGFDGHECSGYNIYFEAESRGVHGNYQYNFINNKLKKISD